MGADTGNDYQGSKELHEIIIHKTCEVADDEDDSANDGKDDSRIEFHDGYMMYLSL